MKKIIGAAVAAALTFGAFAEVTTSLNIRTGGFVFEKKDVSKDAITIGDLDGITGTDALTFAASNDYAGVKLNYNPKLASASNASKSFWSAGNGVEITGWVKPAEWLKLQVGANKDGIFTAEQAKKDTDDTNWSAAGKYAFLYKPGVLTKNSTGFFLDSLVDVQNNGNQYAMADLSFNEVGPGNLLIRAVATDISSESSNKDFMTDDDDITMSVAPGAMVSYTVKDMFKANIDFQMVSDKDIAFGIYGSPLMVENLTAMLGYTFSTNTSDSTEKLGYTTCYDTMFHAVDLRLRYEFTDSLIITNAFNFTTASEDGSVLQGNGSKSTGDSQIWDAIFAVYKLNDTIWFTANAQIDAVTGVSDETVADLYVTVGAVYNVGKGAAITAGINTITTDITDKTSAGKVTSLSMPVIFRVKL